MKQFLLSVAIGWFVGVASAFANDDLPAQYGYLKIASGVPAPKAVFISKTGDKVSLENFSGRTVLLNLWATWCAPCVRELPSLARISSRLPSEKFVVLAVSEDNGGLAVARQFLSRLKISSLNVYSDSPGRLYREVSARGLPTSLVIDPTGQLTGRFEGSVDWDDERVFNILIEENRPKVE